MKKMRPENLLESLSTTQKLTTGCPILDRYIGGGIPTKSVTEIAAESASGKTQLCLQLLLTAQLLVSHGGLAASSLYIHTEFPYPSNRFRQLSRVFLTSRSQFLATPNDPCDHVFVRGVYDADELFDLLSKIDLIINDPPTKIPVKLIVIDSIAALFRSDFENTRSDLVRRSSLFFKISGRLKWLATRYGLAVVLTNQVVDVVDMDGVNSLKIGNLDCLWSSGRRVSPALGISWANCVNSRLFLSRNEEDSVDGSCAGRLTRRRMQVVFAPHLPFACCEFSITREGVFGVDR